jgi:hypothetical protein
MKLGMYIMAPEPVSAVYFINPFHRPVCVYVYLPIIARQRLDKNVIAVTNTQATKEEFLDASFYMLSVSYQGK